MQIHHRFRNRPTSHWSLVWLLLAGFALRIYRLGDKNVWWDEGLASWAARQSAAAMVHWTATDVHPPLYFWLLHLWRPLSGDTEFGLRLLSVFFGLLTIAATYLLGKQINGRATGLLAALFITLSRFDIGWSQEMRMYALAALLGALALWAAGRVWEHGRFPDWLLYVAFMTAGLYTLYLFVLVLVTANLVWLGLFLPRQQNRWRAFWQWSAAQTAVLLLYAPWLAYALGRIPTWSQANFVAPWSFLKIYWTVLTVGVPLDVDRYAAFTAPLLLLFVRQDSIQAIEQFFLHFVELLFADLAALQQALKFQQLQADVAVVEYLVVHLLGDLLKDEQESLGRQHDRRGQDVKECAHARSPLFRRALG